MLAVHAIWSADSLHVWAEDGQIDGTRTSARAKPGSHPFATPLLRLREALGGMGDAGIVSDLRLFLPTSRGRPRPSPSILPARRSRPVLRTTPRLAPWRVPSLAFGPEHAVGLLLTLAHDAPRRDVAVGTSVPAFAEVVELSLDLVARGRVLPAIVRDEDGRAAARWLPVPDADDGDRIVRLARALPPLCRAEWRPPHDGIPTKSALEIVGGRDPSETIREMVAAIVDQVARAGVRGQRLVPPARPRRPASRSTNEAFLAALTTPDPSLTTDAAEIAVLAGKLSMWHASGIEQLGLVRTTFRLVPPTILLDGDADLADDPDMVSGPDPELDRWRVEFLLQSRQEPSLMVPAERIWRTRGRAAVLAGMVEDPRQHLLTDLGHASRLYPELEQALDGAKPEALVTDTAGAYHFLAQAAPLLEAAGFGVLVPPWWRSQRARLGLRVHARTAKAGGSDATGQLGLETLADYHHEVALGETTLSEAELRRLAEMKVPLVRVRGQWVELRADEIDAALRSLERGSAGTRATVAELLQMGLGLQPSPADLPVLAVLADGWLGELLATDRRLEPMVAPAGFEGDTSTVPGARAELAGVHGPRWPRCLPSR